MGIDERQRELERLFARKALNRRQFVAGLAALGLTASTLEMLTGWSAPVAEAQVTTPNYLVLIVLDAFRPDYRSLAAMPTLDGLEHYGVSFDRAWVAQLESETPTGHATISTGSQPRHDGLIGFEWRDPTSMQEVLDGWPKGAIAGNLERDLRDSGTGSIPLAIKAANPRQKIVTVSSEKPYAAAAMGGWAADYILYHQRSGPGNQTLTPAAIPGHAPQPEFFQSIGLGAHLPPKHFTDWDYLSAMLAIDAMKAYKPQALMVNLPGADVYGHPYGGPASPGVMAQVVAGLDRNIARIVQAYKDAGIYDQTLFVVTSDHGMVQNDRMVGSDLTKAAVQSGGGQYLFHTGGTAADVYLRNPAAARNVGAQLTRVKGVAGSYYQVVADGQHTYLPAPGNAVTGALDDAYRYLLSSFAGPTAPDVVAPFRENTIGTAVNSAHGDHGGLNWGAQHVPLIMSGPGVRTGIMSHAPVRLADVAPTVLRLLGLPALQMDGAVVPDVLTNPSAAEVANWAALAPQLSAYQDALMAQSTADIAEDKQTGAKPPPALPARP